MTQLLVFIEHDQDGITDLSLQCLAKGRELAAAAGAQLGAVVIGSGTAALAATCLDRGADAAYQADDPRLASYLTAPVGQTLAAIIKAQQPQAVLLPASTVGNDLAPYVAAQLGAAALLDARAVATDGGLAVRRLEFDAKALTTYRATAGVLPIITLKDGIAEAAPGGCGKGVAPTPVAVTLKPEDLRVVLEKREVARKTVNLKDAKIIVGGGAGVGGKAHVALLEQLATALGGEVGATRAAVDAGWLSAERQIGQTGVTVRPDLYIACGISGAVQHCVGIREAKTIVAINTDPSAPIFRLAHYRIVGDLKVVIPKLLKLLAG